jgi:hypothetical protein
MTVFGPTRSSGFGATRKKASRSAEIAYLRKAYSGGRFFRIDKMQQEPETPSQPWAGKFHLYVNGFIHFFLPRRYHTGTGRAHSQAE